MKKIGLILALALAGPLSAQHEKGEWFVSGGGSMPFTVKPLRFSPYVQSGVFLAPRFALGLQYRHYGYSALFQTDSYGIFGRYYLLNKEQVGLYGYGSVSLLHTKTSLPYLLKNSPEVDLGFGSSIVLAPNWRLNMEVNLLGRYSYGQAARAGVSYTIPYRKKQSKQPL